MEFWASEVKSGESFKVQPGEGMVLHLSQASLGDIKKEKVETIRLFVDIDGKKLVLGTLFSDKLPQQQFDLVFDRDFELSHNWKHGSVYFYGYLAANPIDDDEGEDSESESDSDNAEEDLQFAVENGKPVAKAKEEKPTDAGKANAEKDPAAGKPKLNILEPNAASDEDEDSSDDASMSEDESSSDKDETDSDQEDEDDDSEEETPKKVATGKKRAADSAIKTPLPEKKAKSATPQKSDGKKGSGHVATPHPSKQAGKTPNKNQQAPKSGGAHKCKNCSRSFINENALESHTKAKHSDGK